MKKFLVLFVGILSFIGIEVVSADTFEFNYNTCHNFFDDYSNPCPPEHTTYDSFLSRLNKYKDILLESYRILFEKYEDYKSEYPYYIISVSKSRDDFLVDLVIFKSEVSVYFNGTKPDAYPLFKYSDGSLFQNYDDLDSGKYVVLRVDYLFDEGQYAYSVPGRGQTNSPAYYAFAGGYSSVGNFSDFMIFDVNFDLKIYTYNNNSIIIHNYRDTNTDFVINSGDVYSTLVKNGNVSDFLGSYKNINLNDYAWVVLSLKDYDVDPFNTDVYVKGEYCVNGVYDYGMKPKEEFGSSVTDVCSPYYSDFTPVRMYILENDLKHNAVYYIKAHDYEKENILRVDTSVFDVHYISQEEADNPIIDVNGRKYTILPYSDLPSDSITNTDEGNWPGESEKFDFSKVFTSPLDFLKDLWGSIVSVFNLITSFIALLPPALQSILFASFTLAIALGIIKILL